MLRQSLVGFVLKVGLSISLLYVALFSFLKPLEAINFYPTFLTHSADDRGIIFSIGILSLLFIGWIFSGKQKFLSSLVITFLIGIVALINVTKVSFLLMIAPTAAIGLALVIRYYPRIRVINQFHVPETVKKVLIYEDANDTPDNES